MEYSSEILSDDAAELERLGQLKLKPLKSEGATSLSYLARLGGKWYFMKRLRPELLADARGRMMMAKEWAVGRSIAHPNIVAYHQFHDADDDCYILMENVEGTTLSERLASSPDFLLRRGGAELQRFMEQLLSAVKELHSHDLVHCDLKPQNLMLTTVGSSLKIIDLGFAFSSSYLDPTGLTPEYAAPEQLAGEAIDARTDIYAIGKILRFIDENSGKKRLPGDYRKLMERCLRDDPAERFQSIDDIYTFLKQCRRRKRWRRAAIAVAAIVALGIGFGFFSQTPLYIHGKQVAVGLLRSPAYDIEYDWVRYRITSERDATCEVVGIKRFCPNARIASEVVHNGKRYRVEAVADSAFYSNIFIKSAYIPEGIKRIGRQSFYLCHNITLLHLPESLEEIGESAFWDSRGVRQLSFGGNRLTRIGNAAFVKLGAQSVVVPEGVTALGMDCFALSHNLTTVTLPASLTTIERGVFYQCPRLNHLHIPAAVARIDEYALYDCTALTDLYVHAPVPPAATQISDNRKLRVHIPAASLAAYQAHECWRSYHLIADL